MPHCSAEVRGTQALIYEIPGKFQRTGTLRNNFRLGSGHTCHLLCPQFFLPFHILLPILLVLLVSLFNFFHLFQLLKRIFVPKINELKFFVTF